MQVTKNARRALPVVLLGAMVGAFACGARKPAKPTAGPPVHRPATRPAPRPTTRPAAPSPAPAPAASAPAAPAKKPAARWLCGGPAAAPPPPPRGKPRKRPILSAPYTPPAQTPVWHAKRLVRRLRPRMDGCLRRARRLQPKVVGRAKYKLSIVAGFIRAVEEQQLATGSAQLDACTRTIFRQLCGRRVGPAFLTARFVLPVRYAAPSPPSCRPKEWVRRLAKGVVRTRRDVDCDGKVDEVETRRPRRVKTVYYEGRKVVRRYTEHLARDGRLTKTVDRTSREKNVWIFTKSKTINRFYLAGRLQAEIISHRDSAGHVTKMVIKSRRSIEVRVRHGKVWKITRTDRRSGKVTVSYAPTTVE